MNQVMNDDATVIKRAAEHLVRMAGGYSLKQVVAALSEDQGVVDSVLAALEAALPSTDLTLAQVCHRRCHSHYTCVRPMYFRPTTASCVKSGGVVGRIQRMPSCSALSVAYHSAR